VDAAVPGEALFPVRAAIHPGSSIGRDILVAAMLVNLLTLPANIDAKGASPMTLSLTSAAFAEGGEIPTRYTCEGQDVSPPLAWSEPPFGTKGLALVVDDPDAPDPKAPKMTWVHWVLYNLPPTAGQLTEAVERNALPTGTREGLNDWKRTGYGGHVRRSAATAISTSSSLSTPSFPTSAGQASHSSKKQCEGMSWRRPNSSGRMRRRGAERGAATNAQPLAWRTRLSFCFAPIHPGRR
jgi:Raf kinase inhibitor-like YbhB/YbcL family protein